ncbi:hypothetical protein V12B01_12655 [Vibrio splendidus 12B01]|nr:hypothetical protein V12B01_12655 [Vibrio splendidus 12B01]
MHGKMKLAPILLLNQLFDLL